MNKLILFVLCLVSAFNAYAQPKIGLTFSPSILINRVKLLPDNADVRNDGSALAFKMGLEVDFDIANNYVFSTGLTYAPKKAGYVMTSTGTPIEKEEYKLQYLQIPLTMKLFTNEVVPDVKGFFQLGILAEVKIFSEPSENTYTLIESFKPYDASLVFGFGAERDSGASTILYAAIVYNRGLINIVNKLGENMVGITDGLTSKLNMISLQLGIKF